MVASISSQGKLGDKLSETASLLDGLIASFDSTINYLQDSQYAMKGKSRIAETVFSRFPDLPIEIWDSIFNFSFQPCVVRLYAEDRLKVETGHDACGLRAAHRIRQRNNLASSFMNTQINSRIISSTTAQFVLFHFFMYAEHLEEWPKVDMGCQSQTRYNLTLPSTAFLSAGNGYNLSHQVSDTSLGLMNGLSTIFCRPNQYNCIFLVSLPVRVFAYYPISSSTTVKSFVSWTYCPIPEQILQASRQSTPSLIQSPTLSIRLVGYEFTCLNSRSLISPYASKHMISTLPGATLSCSPMKSNRFGLILSIFEAAWSP